MTRAHNFSAGPSAIPDEVLQQVHDELFEWNGAGASVMEISHRSEQFIRIAQHATDDFNELHGVSNDHATLFVQGGASAQFAALPLNLASPGQAVDYIDTGYWSRKAIAEAGRLANVNIAASSRGQDYNCIPPMSEWELDHSAAYVHCTLNETIGGVEFNHIPDTGTIPLVADASSSILSRPLDINRFGVIYASAQKNIGPSGLTVVVVRKDLLEQARSDIPTPLHWLVQAANESMSNTPPTFAWYMAGLVFRWLKAKGGLEVMAGINKRKAAKLYAKIDATDFYVNSVAEDCRSRMNVPFHLEDERLEKAFLREAEEAGLLNLRGHRVQGGMRASLYNAVPEAAVDALVDFMIDYEKRNG